MRRFITMAVGTTFFITGCVNPELSRVKETKALPTYSAPSVKPVPPQPKKDPDAYKAADSGRTYSLTLKNADIKDVLMLLSKESGVPIVQDRNLRGIVKIEAQSKKLGEMLFAILKPLGYTATVENGVIMVGRPQLSTRTFRVNYLKGTRDSKSNMSVAGFSAGSASVTTEGKTDFWGAIEDSLLMMVFGADSGIKGVRKDGAFTGGEPPEKVEKKVAVEKNIAGNAQTTGKNALVGNYDSDSGYTKTSKLSTTIDIDDPLLRNNQINQNQLKQLVVNEIAGIIQVTDFSENLDKIAAFLADVEEGSKRQVLIQAHIMEVGLKDSYSMGIDWKYILDKATNLTFAQSLVPSSPTNVFKLSAAGSDFGVLLDAMKEQGNVNMLSSPKITALNNQKAVIKLTTKQVSWVSSKTTQNNAIGGQDTYTTTPQVDEVGIFLDVTPQIGQDNSITMQIHPSVSEIKEISTSPDKTSTKPIIDVREIDTMVDAKAGETIVIAGLISDKLNETKRSVPLLGDIPYLGALFSYNKQERAKAELVIMMTPYILNAKTIDQIRAEHEERLRNMGGTFHLINNLGSMVTEKSSRDWMMERQGQGARSKEQVHITEKKSEVSSTPVLQEPVKQEQKEDAPVSFVPKEVTPASFSAVQPVEPVKGTEKSPVFSSLQEPGVTAGLNENAGTVKNAYTAPILVAITEDGGSIRLVLNNVKNEPKIIREPKNRRFVIQMPGVASAAGEVNQGLSSLGFERVRVSRHNDGIWVVIHAKGEKLPNVVTSFDGEGVTFTESPQVVKPLAAIVPEKIRKKQKERQAAAPAEPAPMVPSQPAVLMPLTVEPAVKQFASPPVQTVAAESREFMQQVAVTTTTSSKEQNLYRTGVAAYKSGNCDAAIRGLSSFIASYPDSVFAADAANYRADCLDKSSR